jgi:hypothetical protein
MKQCQTSLGLHRLRKNSIPHSLRNVVRKGTTSVVPQTAKNEVGFSPWGRFSVGHTLKHSLYPQPVYSQALLLFGTRRIAISTIFQSGAKEDNIPNYGTKVARSTEKCP